MGVRSDVVQEHAPDEFSRACSQVLNLACSLAAKSGNKFTGRNVIEEILGAMEYVDDGKEFEQETDG